MSDLFGIEGAHVLVTGGSSGLGRFFATFLAQRGARVTVAARRADALAKTVDDISAAKGKAQSVVMDVTNAASIETALDTAEARLGPIQIVINNAGVTATRPALQQDEADWDKVGTLIAPRSERDGAVVYTFDIYLQGDRETVFFDV